MVDINTFWYMILCLLGSILLIVLIILGVKLIKTVDRFNCLLDDVENKVIKLNNLFKIVDTITDNLALISDKIIDSISNFLKKIFIRNNNGKEDKNES